MYRTLCAWCLVLLALSPFTAPFSTCDLLKLFTHEAQPLRAVKLIGSYAVESTSDALAVSPITERIQLTSPFVLDDRSPLPPFVVRVVAIASALTRAAPDESGFSPQSYFAELTVLQL